MAQELAKTKKRIASISSTLKITKAMELVATSKLKKWKDKMENINLYLDSLIKIISSCAGEENNTFKININANSSLYIVVTSSLGLCGGYNYNIYKFLNSKINKDDKVLILGTKGLSKLKSDFDIDDEYVSILDHFDYSNASKLKDKIINEFNKGLYKEIHLISTHYKNSLTFIPCDNLLLPLEKLETSSSNQEIIFEPNKEEVLSLLIPKYLNTLLYSKLTEAIVCEYASRRNSMDSASDNAEELQNKLMLEFNKARQQAITQEITEVVAGSNN